MQLHYTFPAYPLKVEFTPGTWGENDWKLGEIACVSRVFYAFPDGTEYAVFKFCARTHTGRKRLRWEVWHNGKFSNNYFNGCDELFPGPKTWSASTAGPESSTITVSIRDKTRGKSQ